MKAILSNQIRIENPTAEMYQYCKDKLTFPNPEFASKLRMGYSIRGVPKEVLLYEKWGECLILPYGCLADIVRLVGKGNCTSDFKPAEILKFGGCDVPLYDYQKDAVKGMLKSRYGILQSKAGSGKTQMGIALAKALGKRTLWLTHTLDLLNQSKERAERFIDKDKIGVIAQGKVNIGSAITFATVQTLSKMDLERYRDVWDVVIVDECHRCCQKAGALTMFAKVLNNLRARNKFGLSATVHRADGLIAGCFALLGGIQYIVPDECVADKVMQVEVEPVYTNTVITQDMCNYDGTINWNKLINGLTSDMERNKLIIDSLEDKPTLILSTRLDHLETLISLLPTEAKPYSVFINGKMTSKKDRALREQSIEMMRTGEKKYLFATYSLAKEGLDIPRLERLILATPEKDYAVIVQSVGRIARTFEGKSTPIVKDIVDYKIKTLYKKYKARRTIYRKENIKINE